MEQFSLDKWLQDKSRKVVTRDGREVDIYYSPTSRIPLIGRTSDNEVHQYTEDGFQYEMMNQSKNDLFFADDEEELTEFEKRIYNLINFSDPDNCPSIEEVKEEAEILLDLARNELMKGFPMWKKCDDNLRYPHIGGLNERYLINKGYCIKISELEKLPKEEII